MMKSPGAVCLVPTALARPPAAPCGKTSVAGYRAQPGEPPARGQRRWNRQIRFERRRLHDRHARQNSEGVRGVNRVPAGAEAEVTQPVTMVINCGLIHDTPPICVVNGAEGGRVPK